MCVLELILVVEEKIQHDLAQPYFCTTHTHGGSRCFLIILTCQVQKRGFIIKED